MSGNLSFGNVQVGSAATATFTITNTGNAALSISGMSASGGLSTVLVPEWSNGVVAPGASQQVTIQFAPKAAQTYSGDIVVASDATGGINTLPVTGSGTVAPAAPGPAPTAVFYVYGGPDYKQYLGFFTCIFCIEYDADSINNKYGNYGSQYSSTSIRANYSNYGSAYSNYSACDKYASKPPRVHDAAGRYLGELTLNRFSSDAISDANIVAWLANDVCKH